MAQFFGLLGTLTSIYMMIIFFRIILTWFSGMNDSRVLEFVSKITDPYINWFRRFGSFRIANLDLSILIAFGTLSLLNRVFTSLALHVSISIGIILAMILQAAWGIISFIIGFMIVFLILRFIAHLSGQGGYSYFWRIVFTISQPILQWINSILLKDRIINFGASIIISIAALGLGYFLIRLLVFLASTLLLRLPI